MSFLKILEIVLGLPEKFPDPEISKSPYFYDERSISSTHTTFCKFEIFLDESRFNRNSE
jgi:hypothetical protein